MEGLTKQNIEFLKRLEEFLDLQLVEEFEKSEVTNNNAHEVLPKAIYEALRKCDLLKKYSNEVLDAMAWTFYGGFCQWSEIMGRRSLKMGVFPKIEKAIYNCNAKIKKFSFSKKFPEIKLRRHFDKHIFKLLQDSHGQGAHGLFDLFTTSDGKKSFGLFSKKRRRTRRSKSAFERLPKIEKLPENSQFISDSIFCRFGYALISDALDAYFKSKGQTFEGLKHNIFSGIGKYSENKIYFERYLERRNNQLSDEEDYGDNNHISDDNSSDESFQEDSHSILSESSASTNSRDSIVLPFVDEVNVVVTNPPNIDESNEILDESNEILDKSNQILINQPTNDNEELPDFSPIEDQFAPEMDSQTSNLGFEVDPEYLESFLKNYSTNFDKNVSQAIYETCVKGVISYKAGDYLLSRISEHECYKSVRSYVKKLSESWSNVKSTKEIEYCPCMLTLYYKEKDDLTECDCGKPRSEAKTFTYESIRSYIIAVCLTNLNQILEVKKEAWNNRHNPNMSFFNDGQLYLDSLKGEADEKKANCDSETEILWLNFGIMGDSVNIKSKTYLGVFPILFHLFDLPVHLRHKNSYTHIPMVTKTIKETPGFLFAQTEVLFDDLMDLETNGMKLKVDGKTYIIKVKILGIVGDQPAINWMTETQGTKATFPCSLCDVNVIDNKLPVLRGNKKDDIESRRRTFELITTEKVESLLSLGNFLNGWKRKTDTEEPSTRRKKGGKDKKEWGIKADFMISRINGDYMKCLTNDLMHVVNENLFPKGIFGVLGDTRYSKMDPETFQIIDDLCTKVLTSLKSLGVFEEYKGDKKLFTKRMAKEGTKAIDSKRFGMAFNLFFKNLFDVDNNTEFFTEIQTSVDEDLTSQNHFNNEEDASDMSSSLSVTISSSDEDPIFGVVDNTSLLNKLTTAVNEDMGHEVLNLEDDRIFAEAIDMHGQFTDSSDSVESIPPPPPPVTIQEMTTDHTSSGDIIEERPVSATSENHNTTKKRGRIPNSEILTDSSSFKELTLLMIELNTIMNLLQSIDVPKKHIASQSNMNSDMKSWYVDLTERIQLFSEKDKCDFVSDIFKLPLHSSGHLIDNWRKFGCYYDFNCMEMERGGKFIKNLVNPNGDVVKVLNKRVPSSCFLKFLEIVTHWKHPNLEQYQHPVTAYSNVIRAKESQIAKFREKFDDQTPVKIKLPSTLYTRGTSIKLKKGLKYAKYRNKAGKWVFIEIIEIVFLESKSNEIYLIEYNELRVVKTWYQREGANYAICVNSKVEKVSHNSKEMWLDDSVVLFGVTVLCDHDNSLFDCRPSFHDLVKFNKKNT